MRFLIVSIIAISAISALENTKLNQAVLAHFQSVAAVDKARDDAIAAAEAKHAADVARLNEVAIRNLKRLINNRSPVTEQAEVYQMVLFINRADQDAVRFFTAIGTIDAVLAEVDNINNVIGKGADAPITIVLVGRWHWSGGQHFFDISKDMKAYGREVTIRGNEITITSDTHSHVMTLSEDKKTLTGTRNDGREVFATKVE